MSPSQDFWRDFRENENLVGLADSWSRGQLDHPQQFACKFTSRNGSRVLGILTIFEYGEGTLHIPTTYESNDQNKKAKFGIDAAIKNKTALGIGDHYSLEDVSQKLGLDFKANYPSTYSNVHISSSGSTDDGKNIFSLSIQMTTKRYSFNLDNTHTEIAVGVTKDIEAVIKGSKIEPVDARYII